MRSLLIAAMAALFLATSLFAMGKKDATKKQAEEPLKATKPAEKPKTPPTTAHKPAKSPQIPANHPQIPQSPTKPAQIPQNPTKPDETAPKPTAPPQKPAKDNVIATINGKPLLNTTIEARLDDAMKMQMGHMAGAMATLPPETIKSLRDKMRKDVIDGLVLEQLVDEKLKADKVEVTDKDVDAKINDIMTQNSMTLDKIQEELAKNGVTLQAFRDQLERNIGIERLIDKEITAAGEAVTATDEVAKKFYDENAARFSQPEQVRASHILIKSDDKMDEAAQAEAKKKAEELLAKAKGGEDFAELARQHSEDPGSKAKGGEYVFARGRMVKPFEDAAFSMEPGQISDLVKTQYGYHIIKLSEKLPAKTQTFDEVKDRIKEDLTNQKKGRYWMTLREKLKNEAKIEWSPEEKARIEAAEKEVIRPHPPMQTTPPKAQPKPAEPQPAQPK